MLAVGTRSKIVPSCHPDRPHEARGMCRICYSVWYWRTKEKRSMRGSVAPTVPKEMLAQVVSTNGNGNGNGYHEPAESKYDVLRQALSRDWHKHFPGAHSQFLEELPRQCPRAGCGGQMITTETGVKCINCGRQYVAAEEIVRQILRGRGTVAVDQ